MLDRLLNHPDFRSGVRLAQEVFLDHHDPTPLTLEQMVNEVEENLSRAIAEQSKEVTEALGVGPSYFYHLGFVFGTINEGLKD